MSPPRRVPAEPAGPAEVASGDDTTLAPGGISTGASDDLTTGPTNEGDPTPARATDDEPAADQPAADQRSARELEAGRIVVDDLPTVRVHHPSDLLGAVVALLGIVLVIVLATYAQHTTTGVAEDVQGFAELLQRILLVPVQVLLAVVTLVVPLAVLTELALRRLGRQLIEVLIASVAALVLNVAIAFMIHELGSDELVTGLSLRGELSLPAYIAMLSALLTVAGPRSRRRTVTWSWNLMWFTIGVLLITASVSLPGVAVSLLVGRVVGLVVKYLSGVRSERAYGASLVDGVRRAGFEPVRLRRVPTDDPADEVPDGDQAVRALVASSGYRAYELDTVDGRRLDVVVIDGDRQVAGMVSRVWRSLRLRGLEGRSVTSLRQTAERAALLSYAVEAAGTRTPELLAVAEEQDSMLLVHTHPGAAVPLSRLAPDDLTDDLLHDIWTQLRRAHRAGISHRALTSDTVLVDLVGTGADRVWLVGWGSGYVASTELTRRMDVAQLLAVLALRVGAQRALASAADSLSEDDVAQIGPLLQSITLPRETRTELRTNKRVLNDLRTELVARIPQADVEPQQLVRFGARTVLTIVVPIIAVLFVVTRINIDEISSALAESDWRWTALAFALGLLTIVGAAVALIAFAPVRLPVVRTHLVQSAASFVALAAPAGLGPAALNMRMLTKRGVSTPLAAATVAVVQVSQFTVTIIMLVLLSLVSGGEESSLPISPAVLVVIAAVGALVGLALLIPRVRAEVLKRIMPTLRQTWPRLVDMIGKPWRLALAVAGNLTMTLGFVLAFDACLHAFGQEASLIQVAIVYLAGNTAGAMVPTPGGMGAIEVALAASLTAVTGINAGVATSVAVLFRVVTYWVRIPIGWLAMRHLQRVGEL
ncbi:lysylphosphatidylglycerol synthase transmembrane domain-containing protein [Cellulomonas composti]|uniref:Membrane protein n=1 Tax=Cellulomonas composti TaxID=266130 RepID=A0A511JDI0_9CELL|nr:lysylphosphatidylglycerol synthase transmembrane domain-containing protein [Cellulomonas composti]GEL96006.1 membrane protein [Cellulomonas composti]